MKRYTRSLRWRLERFAWTWLLAKLEGNGGAVDDNSTSFQEFAATSQDGRSQLPVDAELTAVS